MNPAYRTPHPLPPAPPAPRDAYLRAWTDLERRRAYRWLAFFAWAPCALLVILAFQAVFGEATARQAFFWIALPFGLVAYGFMARASFFECPRCDERFESSPYFGNPFTRTCVHCGLRIGTPRGDESRAHHA